LGAVVYSRTTVWVIVRVGREACSAGTLAPAREPSRVESFFEWCGAVGTKVNTTPGESAFSAIVVVDDHRYIEAVNERNIVIIKCIVIRAQFKFSNGNWRLSWSGAEKSTRATSIKARIWARISGKIAITTTPDMAAPIVRQGNLNRG